jgi:alpha-tubulin suppressor-like RCC1 family protein
MEIVATGSLKEGMNSPTEEKTPKLITFISSGDRHTLALDENGDVWSWGRDEEGQCGLGHNNNQSTPTKVILPLPSEKILHQLHTARDFRRERT